MAGFQLAQGRLDDDADIDDWMAQRNAGLRLLGPDAAVAGHEAWSQSTRTGQNLAAAQPSDVAAIGVQALGSEDRPEVGSVRTDTPLPLAAIGARPTSVETDDVGDLTSVPSGYRVASRFATARPGDSISSLLRSGDPGTIGKFLTVNGLVGQDSTLISGRAYAIPSADDDASRDEREAGQRLLQNDNARLASMHTKKMAVQVSANPGSSPVVPAGGAPAPGGVVQYGALHADLPSNQELAELRRQQAAFSRTSRNIDLQNGWFALPALAPLAVLGLEGAGAWAADALAPELEGAPLELTESDPYVRVGDNWSTRAGRRAHAALKERVTQKPGWDPEPTVQLDDGRIVRPDVRTPSRVRTAGSDPKPFQMELKPNTPSGRRAATRALKKYEGTGVKTRPIFYDPKPFI